MNTVQIILGHLQEPKTNIMIEPIRYVTVLDFEQGEVCQYPISIWPIEHLSLETKLTELGHNIKNCEWMVHKNKPIIH